MSHYFFNIYNGHQSIDDVGTHCETLDDVRAEAVGTIQELVRNSLLERKNTSSIIVQVTDQDAATVMLVHLAASVEVIEASRPHQIISAVRSLLAAPEPGF